MTTFALITTFASLVIFVGWLALNFSKHGILSSYSSYAAKWPLDHGTNLWSIVTVAIALLLVPAMLEVGDESPLQFLGFFAPAYLIVAAVTPDYEYRPGDNEYDQKRRLRQRIIHFVGAVICAAASVIWVIVVLRLWYLIAIALVLAAVVGYLTKTLKERYPLWLELALFAAVYGALILGVF